MYSHRLVVRSLQDILGGGVELGDHHIHTPLDELICRSDGRVGVRVSVREG